MLSEDLVCANAFNDEDDEDTETFKVDVVGYYFSVGLVIFCEVLTGMFGIVTDVDNY